MKKLWIPFCLILFFACGSNKTEESVALPEPASSIEAEPDVVTAATAVTTTPSLNGTIVVPPQNRTTITLTMDGNVKNTSLLPGKYVKKGEVLVVLENPEFINLQQVYLDSYAQAEFLETEYLRQETLSQQEVASQKKFQQSKADYLSMKSKKDAAAAQLSLLGINPASLIRNGIVPFLEIRAPISGYISNVQINVGKHISAGTPICEIIDKSQAMVKLIAYEKDINLLHVGDTLLVHVNGADNHPFQAVLVSIGQQVDPISRSLEVYGRLLETHTLLRPGMYISATVPKK